MVASLSLLPSAGAVAPCNVNPDDHVFYVRTCANQAECNDLNTGDSPTRAWATIGHAAAVVQNGGETVIVGPGVYMEGDISLERSGVPCAAQTPQAPCQPRPISFIGDATGSCTGDAPGPVVVDVDFEHDTGFLVFGASDVVISGFQITQAEEAAIQIRVGRFPDRISERAVIANNVIFENYRGIEAMDATEPLIFNNLIHRNAATGIAFLSVDNGRIINNTLYDHVNGIVIAENPPPAGSNVASVSAWVINNIVAANFMFAIDVDQTAGCDYIGAYNLLTSAMDASPYSDRSPRDRSDIRATDAGLVNPDDGDFRLAAGSPALDAGAAPVEVLGLQDSTARFDGALDTGQVDLGFHAAHVGHPLLLLPPITTKLVYVSTAGDDSNDGLAPERPMKTISRATDNALAATRIIVAPGVYRETVSLPTRRPAGPVELLADTSGSVMGTAPGVVVVDARGQEDGIRIVGHCSTIVDGFAVKGANDNGIYLDRSHRSTLRNNMSFSNRGVGIRVVQSDQVEITNNLVYANGDKARRVGGGIQIGGGNRPGSHKALVQNNTVYGNGVDGILVGAAAEPSIGARVRYNVIAGNGGKGLEVNDDEHAGISTEGLCVEFNINPNGYGPVRPENCALCTDAASRAPCIGVPCQQTGAGCQMDPASDLSVPPGFVEPIAGSDQCLGEEGFWDDGFRLKQRPAQQDVNSLAVDFSNETAAMLGLDDRTTRTDGVADSGNVDAGYHYVIAPPENVPAVTGDCDHDRRVSVSELVLGVSIALGQLPLMSCPDFDADHDGAVDVRELTEAVDGSMACAHSPA